MSADGRFLAYVGYPREDYEGAPRAYRYDRSRHVSRIVSRTNDDRVVSVEDFSENAISDDGRFVAFDTGSDGILVRDVRRGHTVTASLNLDGRPRRGGQPSVSQHGRFTAFTSFSRLVRGDTNRQFDVYVYDRETRKAERISVASGGRQGNGDSYVPALSAHGRFVAFTSFASNLVPGDRNGEPDVFLHDRRTGITRCLSRGLGGIPRGAVYDAPGISGDGDDVAFISRARLVRDDSNRRFDAFVADLPP